MMSRWMQGGGVTAVVVWCLLCTVIGRAFTARSHDPFDRQLYAYIGYEWAHGHVPYIDVWENKPPGIFATSAVGLSILTRDFRSLALLEGLAIIGSLIVVASLLRYWHAPRLVYLSAMVAAAAGANLQSLGAGGNYAEIYLLFPAALSMYLFARGESPDSAVYMVAAGFFTGVAMLFKPTGLAPFLAQAVYLLLITFVWRRLSAGKALTALLLNVAGIALAWMPALAYFGRHDAAWELLNASFFCNVQYGAHSLRLNWLTLPLSDAEILQPLSTLCAFTVAGLLFLPRLFREDPVLPRGLQWHLLLVLLWVLFDLAGAVAGGRAYPHYFLPLVPSLAVAAAFALWALHSGLERNADRRLQYTLLLVFILPIVFTQVADVSEARKVRSSESVNAELIANQINRTVRRGDSVFVWPFRPLIYFSTKLPSPVRYLSGIYIYNFNSAAYERIGQEIMTSIRHAPPTYVVDCVPACPGRPDNPVYTDFRHFIAAGNYVPEYRAGDLQLYRKNSVGLEQ